MQCPKTKGTVQFGRESLQQPLAVSGINKNTLNFRQEAYLCSTVYNADRKMISASKLIADVRIYKFRVCNHRFILHKSNTCIS